MAIPSLPMQSDTWRSLAAVLGVGLVGVLAVTYPLALLPVLAALYLLLRGNFAFRDALAVMLAGNLALTYGFANVGLRGFLPIPFSDGLLIALVAWTLVYQKSLRGIGRPAFFLAAIIGLASIRLATDFYVYGTAAFRDFTTPLEATFVLVGYWALREYGLQWAKRLWMGVACVVVAYAFFFPFLLNGAGPVVGLQQPVHLFGQYVGIGPAVVSALFLFLLRLRAPWCWLAGAVCLAEIAILQMKGVYLAVPMVIVLVGFAAGKSLQPRLWRNLGASMLLGGALLLVLMPFIPEGRVDKLSFDTFVEQFTALSGDEDKAGGRAVSDRIEWQTRAWQEQSKSAGDMIWGMGLGRDLTAGFNAGDANVRKPHNDYVEIQARYGFIGLGLWLAFIASLLIPVWRGAGSSRITRDERLFLLWVLATALTALVIAGTQPLLAYPYGTAAIFCTLGMGLALIRQAEERHENELETAARPAAAASART